MEKLILSELSFEISYPTALNFLELFIGISKASYNDDCYFFSRYLIELFLVEYKSIYYLPSLIAASSLYLTHKISKNRNSNFIKCDVELLSGYSEDKLKDCSRDIILVLDSQDSNLQAVKNKFSLKKYLGVAKIN